MHPEEYLVYVDSQVESFAEEDLLDGAWIEDCALLVVPGGADLPYCRQLNGAGNFLIRREHPAFSASRFFPFCTITMLCSSFPLTGLCAPTTKSLSSDSVTGLICHVKLLVSYKSEAMRSLPGASCSHSASNKRVHLHAPSHSNKSCCPYTPVWYTAAHASQPAGVPTRDLCCDSSGCCCQAMWSVEAPIWGCVRVRTTLAGAWSLSSAAGMCLTALPVSALAGPDCIALLALHSYTADIWSLSYAC